MLAAILTQICTLMRSWGYLQEQVVGQLLYTWHYTKRSGGSIGQIVSGNRRIPRSCLLWYADQDDPQCPAPLLDDIKAAVQELCDRPSRWNALRETIWTIVDRIPEPDRSWILLHHVENPESSVETIADLLTRLIWYAMAQDIAHWKSPHR